MIEKGINLWDIYVLICGNVYVDGVWVEFGFFSVFLFFELEIIFVFNG